MSRDEAIKMSEKLLLNAWQGETIDHYINAALITTAVAEKDTVQLVEYLTDMRDFCDKFINGLKGGEE